MCNKLILSVALLAAAGAGIAAAQPQGNAPPAIDNVVWEISRFRGPNQFPPYAAFVAFDPVVDIARELDLIRVTATVSDPDFQTEGQDGVFYLNTTAFFPVPGYPSPEPPPFPGDIFVFFPAEGEGLRPPPGLPTLDIEILMLIPEFNGRNQGRLRGLFDFDVRWRFLFAVTNTQDPGCALTPQGQLINCQEFVATYNNVFRAIENPLIPTPNPPPFADAGADQTVEVGNTVLLDGSGSFDGYNVGFGFDPANADVPDADQLTYDWEWVSGPERVDPIVRDPVNAPQLAEVTLNQIGVYVYRLTVNDGVNPQNSTDTVTITAVSAIPENRPPTASISGPAGNIIIGSLIRLDGTGSSDPDGDPLTFRWVQTDELGNALSASDTRLFQPLSGLQSPISTWQAVKTGTFYFRLLVSDGDFTASAQTSLTIVPAGTAGATFISPDSPEAADDGAGDRATPIGACGGSLLPLLALPLLLRLMRRAH